MKKVSVLIVGHGSRDESSNQEFEQVVERYRAMHPEWEIGYGYIELAKPSLAEILETMASQSDDLILLPLFLLAAGHVKNDIPLALSSIRSKYPHVKIQSARALGVHPALAELAYERVQSLESFEVEKSSQTAVVIVGRGTSDPDANGDFFKMVRIFAEGRRFQWVEPCFIGVTPPRFEETLQFVARTRPERLLIVPYFLFRGRLISKIEYQTQIFSNQYPWIKTQIAPHLGIHSKLLEVMDERVEEVLKGENHLPCDNCLYRVALPGKSENVGGLKALLWSLRHSFTHTQAAPHVHAHKPIRKHVLVCGNVDCVSRGSIPLLEGLRRLVQDSNRQNDIRITRTSCMGRCGEGPTVAVYPDGIWYRGVQEQDAEELVKEHLVGDRLVSRLVDNIMQ